MPHLNWDNLDAFLDDFATPAKTEKGRTFPVILEEEYYSHELGTYDMDAGEPWATAKETDTAGLKKRARLTIAGHAYWLTHDPAPDGTGMCKLSLSRSQSNAD